MRTPAALVFELLELVFLHEREQALRLPPRSTPRTPPPCSWILLFWHLEFEKFSGRCRQIGRAVAVTTISSSIRTPPNASRYKHPALQLQPFLPGLLCFSPLPSLGISCTSKPSPCPVLCVKYLSSSKRFNTPRAAASTSSGRHPRPDGVSCRRLGLPGPHRRFASTFCVARPRKTVRVMSLQ